MRKRPFIKKPDEAGFLGILEGKKKRAAAEAAARLEEEKRKTFLLQLEAAKQGYQPEKQAAEAAVKLEETKQGSEKTLYITIGVIVALIMVGLYFIKRK